MAGFVANEPSNSESAEAVITNDDGFFPDIDPKKFRGEVRQDKTVTSPRLRECLAIAMAAANRQLATWRARKEAAGHASLADVPAPAVGSESTLLLYYRRAVYCLAKAELLERYQDFDATNSATQQADTQEGEQDFYRRDARWALSDLQGLPRSVVELI